MSTVGLAPRGRAGRLASDALAFAVFCLVPLAASPQLWDQFVTAKWYLLRALVAVWFLLEVLICRSTAWPAALRASGFLGAALVVVVTAGALREGVLWAVEPLAERLAFVLIALCMYWSFRRGPGPLGPLALGTATAVAIALGVGFAQVLGAQPLSMLTAGDQRSSLFGNVNMTAQFLGLSILLLLAALPSEGRGRRALAVGAEGLVVASLVYLYFLSSRSVVLALTLGLAVRVWSGRTRWTAVVRMTTLAALGVLLLVSVGGGRTSDYLAAVRANKSVSPGQRLGVWRATLALVRDHPLGVGAGNFGDAFVPYQLGEPLALTSKVIFRHPHNEYLRLLAEEGVVGALLLLALLAALLRALHRAPALQGWRSPRGALLGSLFAFLAVEALFQFPLGLAFSSLVAATTLGLAFAVLEEPPSTLAPRPVPRAPWVTLGALASAALCVATVRAYRSEELFVTSQEDRSAQAEACRLNSRNLPACVQNAWLEMREERGTEARAGLLAVLERSPYYHPAIKLLADEAFARGELPRACHYAWVYDALFRGLSPLHQVLWARCPNEVLGRARARVPSPFYARFPLADEDNCLPMRRTSGAASQPAR